MLNDESMTIYKKGEVRGKDDEMIALRGELDSLQARCVYLCSVLKGENDTAFQGVAEILEVVTGLIRCEALCESMEFCGFFNLSDDELRQYSHNPKKYLGVDHYFLGANENVCMAELNLLRTQIRACERVAVKAIKDCLDWGDCIKRILNRMSSAAYILMLKLKKEEEGQ